MFLLDTNVVSEAMRPAPDPAVEMWFKDKQRDSFFLSAVTKAELLAGLAIMPEGRRKLELANVIWHFFAEEVRTDVLPFGSVEAEHYAEILSIRRRIGRPISQFDAQIASIARARELAIVTRNVGDFAECAVELVNPWTAIK